MYGQSQQEDLDSWLSFESGVAASWPQNKEWMCTGHVLMNRSLCQGKYKSITFLPNIYSYIHPLLSKHVSCCSSFLEKSLMPYNILEICSENSFLTLPFLS